MYLQPDLTGGRQADEIQLNFKILKFTACAVKSFIYLLLCSTSAEGL